MKQNIVITGSSSKLGQVLTKSLDKEFLILHSNKKIIKKKFLGDFRNQKKTEKFVQNIISLNKKIDALIHLPSGKIKIKNFYKYSWKEFLSQLNIQFRSLHILLSKLITKNRISNNFKLIVITSDILNNPNSGMADYFCTKSILHSYLKIFNIEFNKTYKAFEIRPKMFKSPLLNKIPNFIVEKYVKKENIIEKKIASKIKSIINNKEQKKILNI